jgi:hypothetical protein
MKVLLDECTPHVLKRLLTRAEITTVQEMGWSGITNGNLLKRQTQFDVLITSDENWKYQQNLAGVQIAIIQLPTNQIPKVIALAPVIQASLKTIQPGATKQYLSTFQPSSKLTSCLVSLGNWLIFWLMYGDESVVGELI